LSATSVTPAWRSTRPPSTSTAPLLSGEFTKLTAWILVILTPMLWPTDALLFGAQPEVLAFFATGGRQCSRWR